ncbi:MAG: LAO/AO transport system kinase [Oleispira sp.]|jgi:LAO/AO transport system kinase|tara:strand:+ start:554 stop:1522 length:969 start_codon:yes stop_codon:yes gene_type:complete
MIDLEKLKSGNRRALAKAITLVESKLDKHRVEAQDVLNQLLPETGSSIRIGISGIPGVGKSTFIEAFGQYLISLGKKVAVLAVDPSSPLRGGSILGDKTRMEMLSREENAFIRPSPSEGALGGVAQKTRETMLLCEAAGYDVILVETVGVGQSEYEVAAMVDFFLVLMLPNAGDELQGIKRGIMELADALVINKADGESLRLAQQTQGHYKNAFKLMKQNSFWTPQVETCSAINNERIEDIWKMITAYQKSANENINAGISSFIEKRARQNSEWLKKLIHEMLELKLKQNPEVKSALPKLQDEVLNNKTTPYNAAQQIIDLL